MPPITKFRDWPEFKAELNPKQVQRLYEKGCLGTRYNPAAIEALRDMAEVPYASEICHMEGYADSTKGQLVIPFVHVLEAYPNAWPGPAQQRGSCVMHSSRNTQLGTMCGEVYLGEPDEQSGHLEDYPEVSPEAEKAGVLAMEPGYWLRGHRGDGWYCPESLMFATTTIGAVLRKDYTDIGLDLTKLDSRLAGKYYKKSQIPEKYLQSFGMNLFRTTTEVDGFEANREMLARMFFLSTCGNEGYSDQRNEHGVSNARGSWAHAYCRIGVDDRPWAHQTYGGPLTLELNSWNVWNEGPRDIHDSAQYVPADKREEWIRKGIVNSSTGNIMIPKGAWWSRWKDARRRYVGSLSGLNGWKRKRLPDLSPGFR